MIKIGHSCCLRLCIALYLKAEHACKDGIEDSHSSDTIQHEGASTHCLYQKYLKRSQSHDTKINDRDLPSCIMSHLLPRQRIWLEWLRQLQWLCRHVWSQQLQKFQCYNTVPACVYSSIYIIKIQLQGSGKKRPTYSCHSSQLLWEMEHNAN